MTTQDLQRKIEEQLGACIELSSYADHRTKNANRPYLPDYHFASPGGYLNDPCGYCVFQGIYHMFYQHIPDANREVGWDEHAGKLGWGHAVSVDKIHWFDLPAAIMPHEEVACGSGGILVEAGRALAFYQGDMPGERCGAIHVCESRDDLLIHWQKLPQSPIIRTYQKDGTRNPYNAFDPYAWKDGDTYYLLSAGGGSLPHDTLDTDDRDARRSYLFSSKDLIHWEYHHSFIEDDRFADIGDDGACPYFLPIGNGKHLLLHYSHMSGAHYLVGRYDKTALKFHAEQGGALNRNAYYSGVHAPSAFVENGKVHAVYNINYGYYHDNENQIMSLPRTFALDEENHLLTEPDGDYASLRYAHVHEENRLIPANTETVLSEVTGKALELQLTFDVAEKSESPHIFIPHHLLPMVEIRVLRSPDTEEYTAIRFFRNRAKMCWDAFIGKRHWADSSNSVVEIDTSHASLSPEVSTHPTESQEYYLSPDEPIKLHVFVDKSIVEVFADNKKCLSVRTYPTRDDSVGVSVISRGVAAKLSYDAWKMKKIY